MPTKNVVKVFIPDAFYHVYNRGWNLGKIFLDKVDYLYFERLLERHLSPVPVQEKQNKEYRHYYSDVRLVAYCLMGNHFHLLFYQYDEGAITRLMMSLMTAYTAYFNKRHKRRGSLFESTYKAVWIARDEQLMHITRYIHLNHSKYISWKHSSYQDYLKYPKHTRQWIEPKQILKLFASKEEYEDFVADYEELQHERDDIKAELYGI